MPSVEDEVMSGLNKTAEALTHEARARATRYGWPVSVTSNLFIINDEGTLRPNVPDHLKTFMENLEFGSTNSAPRPAMGTLFSSRESKSIISAQSRNDAGWVVQRLNRLFS